MPCARFVILRVRCKVERKSWFRLGRVCIALVVIWRFRTGRRWPITQPNVPCNESTVADTANVRFFIVFTTQNAVKVVGNGYSSGKVSSDPTNGRSSDSGSRPSGVSSLSMSSSVVGRYESTTKTHGGCMVGSRCCYRGGVSGLTAGYSRSLRKRIKGIVIQRVQEVQRIIIVLECKGLRNGKNGWYCGERW